MDELILKKLLKKRKLIYPFDRKVKFIITIGEKETKNNTLVVRTLDGKVKFGIKSDMLISNIKEHVEKRKIKVEI